MPAEDRSNGAQPLFVDLWLALRGRPVEYAFLNAGRKLVESHDLAQPWLSEVSLFSETAGHFARYKVAEKDFM